MRFELIDLTLAHMRPFGKLLLNLLVKGDVALESINLFLHLVILGQKLLRLLRLVLQFSGQLMVLEDGQARSSVQLLIVESHQVGLGFFYLVVHFLTQFLNSVDLCTLTIVDFDHSFLLL